MERPAGFSRTELIVATAIALAFFAVVGATVCFYIPQTLARNQMKGTLSNMKQLHLAASQMALDGETTKDPNLAWPGDLNGDFIRWRTELVPSYLGTNDLVKLFSAPGRIVRTGGLPSMSDSAVLIYAVRSNSPGNTVFLSTANFTNSPTGGTLDPDAQPYGKFGIVLMHRDGTGHILHARDAGKTNIIGAYAPLCQ